MSSNADDAAGWNSDTIAEKVLAIVRAKTPGPVSQESTFDSLGLDSLAMAEVVFEIENTFQIRTDERLLNLRTIREVVDYVADKVKKGRPAKR
jgi:acyl carrier protein